MSTTTTTLGLPVHASSSSTPQPAAASQSSLLRLSHFGMINRYLTYWCVTPLIDRIVTLDRLSSSSGERTATPTSLATEPLGDAGEASATKPGSGSSAAPYLHHEDLYALPEEDEIETLIARYRGAIAERRTEGKQKTEVPYFMPALSTTTGPLMWATAMQAIRMGCEVVVPIFIRAIIQSIEAQSMDGIYWIVGLFFLGLFQMVATSLHFRLMDISMIRVRAVTLFAVYEKATQLKASQSEGLQGRLGTLVASDCQRFLDGSSYFQQFWSSPLQIIISTYVISTFISAPALVSVAVMLLIFPLSSLLSSGLAGIRRRQSVQTQGRVQRIAEFLQGVRVVKMNGWEPHLRAMIDKFRISELGYLVQELFIWAFQGIFLITMAHIAAIAGFAVFVEVYGALRPADAFATLSALSLMKFPVMQFGMALNFVVQLRVGVQRIRSFLSIPVGSDETDDGPEKLRRVEKPLACVAPIHTGTNEPIAAKSCSVGTFQKVGGPLSASESDVVFSATNATFVWSEDSASAAERQFQLKKVNLELRRGEFTAIVGPVGSGKSLLCSCVLGETVCTSGVVSWSSYSSPPAGSQDAAKRPKIAFAAQEPFLMSGTVRDNITFLSPFDDYKYLNSITSCQLIPDFEAYPEADMTIVGERGVTLSGGQKARIALARVVYAEADLVILDDPFSALDVKTGNFVSKALLDRNNGLLRDKAVLFVTHSKHVAQYAHQIITLDGDGEFAVRRPNLSEQHGSASGNDKDDSDAAPITDPQRIASLNLTPCSADDDNASPKPQPPPSKKKLDEEQPSTVKGATYWEFMKHAGGPGFGIFVIFFLIVERTVFVSMDYWLAIWTSANAGPPTHPLAKGHDFPAGNTNNGSRFYVRVFAVILCISFLLGLLRLLWFGSGGYRATRNLFNEAIDRVMRCPMIYFDVTPAGRILNRLTHDVDRTMYPLIVQLSGYFATLGWLVTGVVVVSVTSPYTLIAIVPSLILVFYMLTRYRTANVHFQRLDAMTRSSVQSHIFESVVGAPTIRALAKELAFQEICKVEIQTNAKCLYNSSLGQRWISARVDLCGILTLVIVPLVCWLLRSSLSAQAAGVAIMWGMNLPRSFTFMTVDGIQGEAKLVSVERLVEFGTSLPAEPARRTGLEPAEGVENWPQAGEVVLDEVRMRYRPELPLVLDGANLRIHPGKRIGIVGRTGAGKSSIAVALFRLRELVSGQIRIDGLNIAPLGLDAIRGSRIAIVPQDPILFSGSIRSNVDPFNHSSDEEVISALKAVQMWTICESGIGLDTSVGDQGKDLSVGQRQLVCIARALVRKPRILVLDEATANVDHETDVVIQKMVRVLFAGTTIIEVAHRLHTVMDADEIVVMNAGTVAEVGAPAALLKNPEGYLTSLVEATGPTVSAELRAIAEVTAKDAEARINSTQTEPHQLLQ
jgi:ATP-binding cassette subfamily C (CFTR/MRP) protein 1